MHMHGNFNSFCWYGWSLVSISSFPSFFPSHLLFHSSLSALLIRDRTAPYCTVLSFALRLSNYNRNFSPPSPLFSLLPPHCSMSVTRLTLLSYSRGRLTSALSPLSTTARQQCFHYSSSSLKGHVHNNSSTGAFRSLSNSASSLRMAHMVEGCAPLRLLLIGSPVSYLSFLFHSGGKGQVRVCMFTLSVGS